MKSCILRGFVVTAAYCIAALAPSGARAQASSSTAGASGLEEVVVTAQRRQERLEDVPVSVAAYSQQTLDAESIRSIDDVARLTPGIVFQRLGAYTNYNGEDSELAIRGIESNAGPATTGLYLDDTPIQSRHLSFGTLNAYPALFDLERVEVLRGPQGTLFGAGSEGGTVRFITPDPGLHDYTGYMRSELGWTDGGDPSYSLGAAVGGPIIPDRLGFRLAVSYENEGGWVDHTNYQTGAVVDPRSNWQDTVVARGALRFAATDTLTITPSIYYQKLYVNDTSTYWRVDTSNPQWNPAWPTPSNPSQGVFDNGGAANNPSTDPFYIAAVKAEWALPGVTLISNTSYFSRSQHSVSDYTEFMDIIYLGDPFPAPGHYSLSYFTDNQDNFVQEIRLQSSKPDADLTWVLGAFYSHQRENTTQFIYDPTLPADWQATYGYPFPSPLFPGGYAYIQSPFLAIDKQYAVYGQLDYQIVRGLKITAGLRAASVTFSGDSFYEYPLFVGPPVSTTGSANEHPLTPKFGLSYEPNRNNMFYATAAKGYRIGGLNTGLPPSCNPILTALGYPNGVPPDYKSDSVWSYELGTKNTLWDRRLQIAASAFYIKWQNIQQNLYMPACGFQFTANLANAVSSGADVDARLRASEHLTLGLAVGYTDARYTTTVPGSTGNVVTDGDRLPGAPWVVTASGEYVFPVFDTRKPYFRVDYQVSSSWSGRQPEQDSANVIYDPTIPSYGETKALSARTGVRWGGFDVSFYGQNLLNTHPLLFTAHDLITSPLYFDLTWRPRTLGITGTYRY
jgi:outer membrane receptor protein involved in Fe transport